MILLEKSRILDEKLAEINDKKANFLLISSFFIVFI